MPSSTTVIRCHVCGQYIATVSCVDFVGDDKNTRVALNVIANCSNRACETRQRGSKKKIEAEIIITPNN